MLTGIGIGLILYATMRLLDSWYDDWRSKEESHAPEGGGLKLVDDEDDF